MCERERVRVSETGTYPVHSGGRPSWLWLPLLSHPGGPAIVREPLHARHQEGRLKAWMG
jgi:hypothetical protein